MGLIEAHYTDLLRCAKAAAVQSLGGPSGSDYAADAEDIAQEAIVKLLEMEEKGTLEEKTLFGLVSTTAANMATDLVRREGRRREIEQEHGKDINRTLTGQSAEILSADPYEMLAYEEMRERLDSISPLLYHTTHRYYVEGWTVCGIAETDGITEEVVYKRLQRARDIVRGEEETSPAYVFAPGCSRTTVPKDSDQL